MSPESYPSSCSSSADFGERGRRTASWGGPVPQAVDATQLADGRIAISWATGPVEAQAVQEYTQGSMDGYAPLAVVDAVAGVYRFDPGEPDTYVFRIKFVQDDNESAWVETPVLSLAAENNGATPLFVPSVARD